MTEDNIRQIWSDAELDAALADLHGDTRPGSATDLSFARATLLSAAGVETEAEPVPAKKRVGSWRWIAVAAAVVTLTGGLAIALEVTGPTAPDVAHPGPATTLSELDRPLAPGEFHYAKKTIWVPLATKNETATNFVEQTVELWVPADPQGVWHRRTATTANARGELSDANRAKIAASAHTWDEFGPGGLFPGDPHLGGTTNPAWNTPFANWNTPDAKFIASLVPDDGTLSKRLRFDTTSANQRSRSGMHSAPEALGMVRNVLGVGLLRKDVRVALCKALSTFPGIVMTEGTTTPNGLPATAFIAKETREVLYIDPGTSQLISASTLDVMPDGPLSAVLQTPNNTPGTSPIQTTPTTTSTSKPPQSDSFPPPTMTTRPGIPSTPPNASEVTYIFSITQTSGP